MKFCFWKQRLSTQIRCIHIGGISSRMMKGYWGDMATQKEFFDNLAKKLNFQEWTDWYHISKKDIDVHGGGSLLRYYKNSPIRALYAVYPSYPWKFWLFKQVPRSFWKNLKNQVSIVYNHLIVEGIL